MKLTTIKPNNPGDWAACTSCPRRWDLDKLHMPRPLSEWYEDFGFALFHRMPIKEPPYVGDPNCSDWPFEDGENIWWTPLPDGNEIMRRWRLAGLPTNG
jgi:hypothetical protein